MMHPEGSVVSIPNFLLKSLKEVGPESETYCPEVSSANRTTKRHTNLGEGMAKITNIAGMLEPRHVTCSGGAIDQLDSPMRTRDRIMTHLTKQLLQSLTHVSHRLDMDLG